MVKNDPENCGQCKYLYHVIRADFYPACPEYFCCKYDPELIGFVAVKPEWCPLEQEKPPPMHYLIVHWNPEMLKWDVVHYSHLLEDIQRMMLVYPEPEYVHVIDLKWVKSHGMMEQVQAMRERAKQQLAQAGAKS